MSAISKELFYTNGIPDTTCKSILHPFTNNCLKGLQENVLCVIVGSTKFYFLIYLLRTISKWKKIDKKFIIKQIAAYVRSVCFNTIFAFNLFASLCLLRHCFGKFYFYNLALSGAIASTALFFESKQNRTINTILCFNLVVETLLRSVLKIKSKENLMNTFFFMVCTGTLMYLHQKKPSKTKSFSFWFYNPEKVKTKSQIDQKGNCFHEHFCFYYVIQGFLRYFFLGYGLQLGRYVIANMKKIMSSSKELLNAMSDKKKIAFGLLFGGFVGIYRLVMCTFNKYNTEAKPIYSWYAGFLAGGVYVFNPTLSILSVALTEASQLYLDENVCVSKLGSVIPLEATVFIFSGAFLFHVLFMLPHLCPRYMKRLISINSNGRLDEIYVRFLHAVGNM